ncbi:DUF927 domain-containing protein [Cereibacter sphaeroides]|nr:DUF927 domain-containing protein [Cereibacter sphaeroides]
MFTKLSPDELAKAGAAPKPDEKRPIVPVPADAPPMNFRHPTFGKPSKVWRYTMADGSLVGYVGRFDYRLEDGSPAKEVLPITFCEVTGKRPAWRSKGFPEPRPLYRLHEFAERPEAAVLICEGEKCADAAAELLPEMICTTPPGGAKAPSKADWVCMKGRRVIIATDADQPGREFGDEVARLVRDAGAAEVLHLPGEALRQDAAEGYDIADAVEDGITADQVRRAIRAYDDPGEEDWPFRVNRRGVWKRTDRQDKETGEIKSDWRPICTELHVLADTRNVEGEDWGRLLKLTDRDGKSKTWAMPMSLLAGDGTAIRDRLYSMGLVGQPTKFAREGLLEYIATARPKEKARCVARIGWGGDAFVLPSRTMGDF